MGKYITSQQDILFGTPVVKGTRTPISVILYLLKGGYSLAEIQEMYPWIDKNTLTGAIDEAIEVIAVRLHG